MFAMCKSGDSHWSRLGTVALVLQTKSRHMSIRHGWSMVRGWTHCVVPTVLFVNAYQTWGHNSDWQTLRMLHISVLIVTDPSCLGSGYTRMLCRFRARSTYLTPYCEMDCVDWSGGQAGKLKLRLCVSGCTRSHIESFFRTDWTRMIQSSSGLWMLHARASQSGVGKRLRMSRATCNGCSGRCASLHLVCTPETWRHVSLCKRTHS